MARTYRPGTKYDLHPNDGSRKGYQRVLNKKLRAQTRQALHKGVEALPVMRRQVDWLAH